MDEIHGMFVVCGLLWAIVFSGSHDGNPDPAPKGRQNQGESGEGTVTVVTLKKILEAFNRHDLDAIMEFFSDDCSFDMPKGPEPWGQRFIGKDQVREALAGRFKGIPDVHYGDDRHWVTADMGVSEWTLTGTTTSGVSVKVRGCDLWEFRNGKVIRKDSYWKIIER
jgi:steroid delta-isomerase-like uncharacterized protein